MNTFLEELLVKHGEKEINMLNHNLSYRKFVSIIGEIKRPPNKLQHAVAIAAMELIRRHQRLLFVLPCGAGKSRVTATITFLLLLLRTELKKIHLIYPNAVLMNQDIQDF